MINYCEQCNKEVDYEIVSKIETRMIKDEEITLTIDVGVCKECGEEIFVEELEKVSQRAYFDEYRRRKGLLSPEEIRNIREGYGLSQVRFSKLLGMGDKTIARYENGSIQDASSDSLIRLSRKDSNMRELLSARKDKLSRQDVDRLMNVLDKRNTISFSFLYAVGGRAYYEPAMTYKGGSL